MKPIAFSVFYKPLLWSLDLLHWNHGTVNFHQQIDSRKAKQKLNHTTHTSADHLRFQISILEYADPFTKKTFTLQPSTERGGPSGYQVPTIGLSDIMFSFF